jgi:hypothetical protein
MRRLLGLACLLTASAAFAEAPKLVFAPAGECAGEERELNPLWAPKPGAGDAGDAASSTDLFGAVPPVPTAPAATHLSPTQVASAVPAATTPPPASPVFGGPGACDDPGSGCNAGKSIDDPDPGTGCGFPGSPCP